MSAPEASPQPRPAATTCPRCHAPIPAHAPAGLCPRCLLHQVATGSEAGPGTGLRPPNPPRLAEIAAAFPDLEVLGFLGAGGMGCVYHVRDRATGQEAALKILPRERASDPAFLERFEREARTLARLRHPHIVGVHRFGQSGGFCFLLLEYVDGANLRQTLRAGRFTPAQALALIPDLCDALQHAHAHGVLHRDIKPENILLDVEGRVKIADFGLAKILGEPADGVPDAFTLTHTGARLGTPHYMAPEQVERPEAVDHRADIYSLGVVFYELLTGELPLGRFQVPSAKAALDARVDDIVLRALAKERELRQQSAEQIKAEVEHLASQPLDPTVPSAPSLRRPRIRTLLLGVFLAWLGTWVVIGIRTGGVAAGFSAFDVSLQESIYALPVLLIAATVFVLFHRSVQPGSLRARMVAGSAGLALVVGALALYPRSSLPRVQHPGRMSPTTQSLLALGIHLRTSASGGSNSLQIPDHLQDVPLELRTDPTTGQPFILLSAGQSNPPPNAFLAATPPLINGRRLVLCADGSVQNLPEFRFWEVVLSTHPRLPDPLRQTLVGPAVDESLAEAALRSGALVALSKTEGYRRLSLDLPGALRPVRDGRFDTATRALHAVLTTLPEDPDREILFTLQADLAPRGRQPDTHDKTQARHGGLLALLAAFAARAGDAQALEFALTRGRALWAGREDLLLCERRLDGQSDQNWEEIRMRTAEVLALRPGSPAPMTVIRRFKAPGLTPTTNVVDCAWPRTR